MYCLVYSIDTILTLYFYTDSTSYFTLALFPPHCLHYGELFKDRCALVFLESARSGVYCVCTLGNYCS